MKLADIKQKSDKELALALTEARQQLAQARVDQRTKQVKNVKAIKAIRKQVAQILTIQQVRAQEAVASASSTKEDK